jgi:hypothetical protein
MCTNYHSDQRSAGKSFPSVLETGQVDSGIDLGLWAVSGEGDHRDRPYEKPYFVGANSMFALEARITSSLKIPLAFLGPVRYTLEVSLRAGILFWK